MTQDPLWQTENFENKEYLLSEEELEKLKSDFTVLVARVSAIVLLKFFPCIRHTSRMIFVNTFHR